MNLNEIALKHEVGKSSSLCNYAVYYDMIFNKIKDQSLKILEIGVYKGRSLKMWKEYFCNSLIYGIDINPICKKSEEDKIKIFIGDQSDLDFLNNVKKEINDDIDIIIDDGSHIASHQISSFKISFPFVRVGGYYVIEDLTVAYMKQYKRNSNISGIDFCKNLVDDLNLNGKIKTPSKKIAIDQLEKQNISLNYYERNIEYILFFPGLCVIKKI